MPVRFDHTIVQAKDKQRSARFYADVFGLAEPIAWGHFISVAMSDGVMLEFAEADSAVTPQHYAFLVDEHDFDQIVGRLRAQGVTMWADPRMATEGINHNHGGRGVYFFDPSGHGLEALTRRYGSDLVPGAPDRA
jgi:catechol 2,3-dioxygenase-like lactoylglutathione lyase family enzyme